MRRVKESIAGPTPAGGPPSAVEMFLRDDLGLSASVDDVVAVFRQVQARMRTTPEPEEATSELPADQRAALERVGASFLPLPAGTMDPVERARVAYGSLMLDTLAVEQVARRLGRDASRIRQRLRDRSLWSVPGEGGARLPRIQFADDGTEIAGMGHVLQALPLDLHPVAILGWLARPTPDLRLDDTDVSPRDWLLVGGPVDEVVALAEGLHAA